MSRARVKDVAKAAGVDPSTVSRVMNRPSRSHRYDSATMERIREAARRLGYIPSRTAQALRTGKTGLLALLVSDIANPFFAELAARIERRSRPEGYRLLVCNTDELPERQQEHLQDLLSRGVDGLIVSPSGSQGLREAAEAGVPLVTIDRRVPAPHLPHVGLDDVLAGRMLGEHLQEQGYQRVGVVAPVAGHDPSIGLRLQGLRQGLKHRRAIAWVIETAHLAPPGEAAKAVRNQLQQEPPEVVVGLNLTSTLVALEAISRSSLQVPGQLGLAGIDDFAAAPFLRPAVTVVAQPIDAIAEKAVALLLKTSKREATDDVWLLPPILIQRASLRQMD